MALQTAPRTGPQPGPRLTAGLRQAIGLLSLPAADLVARLAVEAAENPALRLRPPEGDGGGWQRPLLDPDGLTAPEGSLIAHVLQQIGLMRLTPRERALALALAEGLEPTGWLVVPVAAVARACGADKTEVLAVLSKLQGIEPAGLFARSLAECLRLQAGNGNAAVAAVLNHLPLLAAGDMAALSAATGLGGEELARAAQAIRRLDPKPGLAFAGPALPAPPPDLILRRTADRWQAAPHPSAPRIGLGEQGDRRRAQLFVTAARRRQALALQVAGHLAALQGAFLNGTGPLRPVTSADLAGATGAHVATVNRILAAIAVEAGGRRLSLRDLTDRPVRRGGPSAAAVRARLAGLLADPAFRGCSDAALARQLGAEGLAVARRTVAKYRATLCGDRPPP